MKNKSLRDHLFFERGYTRLYQGPSRFLNIVYWALEVIMCPLISIINHSMGLVEAKLHVIKRSGFIVT